MRRTVQRWWKSLTMPVGCALLVAALSLGAAPAANPQTQGPPPRTGYTGDAACLGCHKAQSVPYEHTSHHFTSQLATHDRILSLLHAATHRLVISDPAKDPSLPGLTFSIEEKHGAFYETATTGWPPDLQTRSERIDVVTGSGKRGQTYLSWHDDSLTELPVSYWTDGHQWINSPGYEDGTADFSRPINPGCLECHATYIRPLSTDPNTNQYQRDTLITGISCETCHGPGAAHATRMQASPQPPAGPAADASILNPAKFSRDRQIDLCALCHNGIQRQEIAPAFSYLPGEPLDRYFKPLPATLSDRPDVHGNQVGLLQRSKCFLASPQMTCSTCHDVHAQELPAAAYSQKCLTCHQTKSCRIAAALPAKAASNCIDCHMPIQSTNVIVSQTAGREIKAKMRTHWIRIYPATRLSAAR